MSLNRHNDKHVSYHERNNILSYLTERGTKTKENDHKKTQ